MDLAVVWEAKVEDTDRLIRTTQISKSAYHHSATLLPFVPTKLAYQARDTGPTGNVPPRSKKFIERRMEGQGINSIRMRLLKPNRWLRGRRPSQVHQAHCEIVGDGAEQVLAVFGVVLDVVDGGGVVGEGAGC